MAAEVESEEARLALISREVESEYEADIYLYSAGIAYDGFGQLVESFKKTNNNCILILTTTGGSANAAYKIARFLQNHYKQLIICLPSYCKSAGTLLAIGAHRLVMTPFSELGPLDVQLYEKDEIFARKSGLLSHSALEALKEEAFSVYEHVFLAIKSRSGDNISFPVASNVASTIAVGTMSPIFAQLSPNVIGGDYRDLDVAIHYGERLAAYSENISSVAIQHLTKNYPSHDFIIDMEEAKELFRRVESPSLSLWKLIGEFADIVLSESDEGVVWRVSDVTGAPEEANDNGEAEGEDDVGGLADRPGGDGIGTDSPGPKGEDGAEGGLTEEVG